MVEEKQQAPGAPQGPDETGEVQDELHPVLRKIQENLRLVIGVIAAALLIAGGYAGYQYHQDRTYENAKSDIARAMAVQEPGARAEALAQAAENAPDELATAARLELAATLEQTGDYARAAEVWRGIAENAGPEFTVTAGLGLASSLSAAGEHDRALQVLQELKAEAPEAYWPAVTRKLATVAERAGEYEVAVRAYRELAEETSPQDKQYLQHKIDSLTGKQG
jgi:predicted negative regulator of RcsB-dependent stress response